MINADLIETVDRTPGTLITLVDGKTYVVRETPEEVVERIGLFRAAILRWVDDPRVPRAAEIYVLRGN